MTRPLCCVLCSLYMLLGGGKPHAFDALWSQRNPKLSVFLTDGKHFFPQSRLAFLQHQNLWILPNRCCVFASKTSTEVPSGLRRLPSSGKWLVIPRLSSDDSLPLHSNFSVKVDKRRLHGAGLGGGRAGKRHGAAASYNTGGNRVELVAWNPGQDSCAS